MSAGLGPIGRSWYPLKDDEQHAVPWWLIAIFITVLVIGLPLQACWKQMVIK